MVATSESLDICSARIFGADTNSFCYIAVLYLVSLATALPLLAHADEQDGKKAKPYVPIAWEWEKKAITARRQEFLDHIKGASNISIPKAPDDFSWEIDWDARQAYCSKIANALFADPPRLTFPEPFYSQNRDAPRYKLAEYEKQTFPNCPYQDSNGKRSDLTEAVVNAEENAAQVNRIKPNQQRKLLREVQARRYYRGATENERAVESFTPSGSKLTEREISSSVYLEAGLDDEGCSASVTRLEDEKFNDRNAFLAEGRTTTAHVVVLLLGDEFIAAQYGTYEVSNGDVPVLDKNSEFKLRPDGNSIWRGTGSIQLRNVRQNTTWGTRGQRFVIIRSPGKSLETKWAKTDPLEARKKNIPENFSESGTERQNSCVINFDNPQVIRRELSLEYSAGLDERGCHLWGGRFQDSNENRDINSKVVAAVIDGEFVFFEFGAYNDKTGLASEAARKEVGDWWGKPGQRYLLATGARHNLNHTLIAGRYHGSPSVSSGAFPGALGVDPYPFGNACVINFDAAPSAATNNVLK